MRIAIVGYMGAGKTFWGKLLAEKLQLDFIDLDAFLVEEFLHQSVAEFMHQKGELAFRKKEKEALNALANSHQNFVMSCGGGTPCYFDNMKVINQNFKSIFLNVSIATLAKRLEMEKANRPMISHLKASELPEFIAKHLFERNEFYRQAHVILDEKNISIEALLIASNEN